MSPQHPSDSLLVETRAAKLDRVFAALFLVQWLAVIAYVWLRSGNADDLFTAIVIGAAIATAPTTLIVWKPGTVATRHAIAVAQMLYGTLIVHLTSGKLGTPYHVIVSLAFLALYSDWRVIATAVGVVVFDTVGVGVLSSEIAPARWVQQLGWVAVAAGCLAVAARRASQDLVSAKRTTERPRPMTLILSDASTGRPEAANDDATKVIVQERVEPRADDSLDALGSAPTLRPSAMAVAIQAANEHAIFSDLEAEEGMHELLQGFVQRLRETSIELETTRDLGDLEHIAQRVRGAAGSFGFAGISAAAFRLEDAIQTQIHDAGGVPAEVAHLAAMCRKARTRRLVARAA